MELNKNIYTLEQEKHSRHFSNDLWTKFNSNKNFNSVSRSGSGVFTMEGMVQNIPITEYSGQLTPNDKIGVKNALQYCQPNCKGISSVSKRKLDLIPSQGHSGNPSNLVGDKI